MPTATDFSVTLCIRTELIPTTESSPTTTFPITFALFAKKIEFIHPTTNELLTFELDLPNRYPFTIFNKE